MKKLFLPLIGLVLISISCEKNVSEPGNNAASKDVNTNENIKCKGGVLVFKDQIALHDYENKANRMGISELTKQEESLGFESQKRIFEGIALKEYNIQIKPFEGKTDNEMKNIPFPGHCPEYTSALKGGIIKEINEPEGSYIDYNLTDRAMAVYLNKDGLVMVGNTLYFVKGNSIKSMENATMANSRELIESNSSKPESSNPNIKSVMSGTYTAYKDVVYWVTSGSCRGWLDATYTIQTVGTNSGTNWAQQIQGFPLTVHTNAQQRNFWGKWNQYWGPETISGPASLHLDWSQFWYGPYTSTNGIYNDFSTNYYFPQASNATLTYNPFTGVPDPFIQYSIATAPYNGYYAWGTKPINFNITANLPGGCCGINCNVFW